MGTQDIYLAQKTVSFVDKVFPRESIQASFMYKLLGGSAIAV